MVEASKARRTELPEDEAEGTIKSIYEDIKSTLRVPMVNLVFRALAAQHPDYLQVAWRALKPNAQTVLFESRADAVRRRAVEGLGALNASPAQAPSEVEAVTAVFNYVNPKLLLAVEALRSASSGQEPRLQEVSRDEKRQLRPGVPSGASAVRMIDPVGADPAIAAIFEDIKATLGVDLVNSDYRALACWPEYFAGAWSSLKPIVSEPGYRQLQRELRRMANDTVQILPFRMDISPHALRHSGLSEHDLDGVRALLTPFSALLPGLVINSAFFALGAVGSERAAMSPFPAETMAS